MNSGMQLYRSWFDFVNAKLFQKQAYVYFSYSKSREISSQNHNCMLWPAIACGAAGPRIAYSVDIVRL